METKTSKPSLDSEFDLLSLNKPSNTNAGAVVPEAPKSSVTDLLGLGGKSIKNDFNILKVRYSFQKSRQIIILLFISTLLNFGGSESAGVFLQ